jgi:dihydrofolate reductase
MGILLATMNVTLDGCCDHTQVRADDEFHAHITDVFSNASALLFGRNTFELLHGYWPDVAATGQGTAAEVRFARVLEGMPKYVVSRQDPPSSWNASRTSVGERGERIRTLKERIPGILLLVASPGLARTLLELSLVDEYHLAIQPIFAGRGPTFLAGLPAPIHLELRETLRLSSGVVVNRYGCGAPHSA